MRNYHHLLGIICLVMSLQSQATDPFDHAQRESAQNTITPIKKTKGCAFNEAALAAESAFEQLKLVGIVLYKQQPEALFLDMRQQLIIAKKGQRLGQEGYLLEQLRKNGIQILRPKLGQCEQVEPVDIRF